MTEMLGSPIAALVMVLVAVLSRLVPQLAEAFGIEVTTAAVRLWNRWVTRDFDADVRAEWMAELDSHLREEEQSDRAAGCGRAAIALRRAVGLVGGMRDDLARRRDELEREMLRRRLEQGVRDVETRVSRVQWDLAVKAADEPITLTPVQARLLPVGEVIAQRVAGWIDSAPLGASIDLPPDASGEGRQFREVEQVIADGLERGRIVVVNRRVTRVWTPLDAT
ncbi:MAG TPA: hypothetical protein VG370_03205 [Chloroflexota bacterium]|nr:hypothetical protein [Chloroflexota bacterium]